MQEPASQTDARGLLQLPPMMLRMPMTSSVLTWSAWAHMGLSGAHHRCTEALRHNSIRRGSWAVPLVPTMIMRPSPSVWSRSQGCIPPPSAMSHPSARRGVTRPQSQGVTMHVVAAAVTHMSELWLLVLLLPSISIGQDSAVTSKMSGSSMQPHHSGVLNLQQQQHKAAERLH